MADIAEEYRSSLSELNFNSKPHINMLTMLAEENIQHASLIVQAIVSHINSVPPDVKLPSLYLVDSIVKNIGKVYVQLFSKHLVSLFTSVFEKVDENIRSLLYKLRSTWTEIFPNPILLQLDKSVALLDPAWPILAQPTHKNIHLNPKFLDKQNNSVQLPQETQPVPSPQIALLKEVEMKKQQLKLLEVLQKKKQELIHLRLKAALAPSTAETVKVDTKKPINARDPRLSKKVPAASSGTDSTVLQSVVVVPKGNDKKTDKDFPPSKKAKLDEALSNVKKNSKNKPNSDSKGFEDGKRLMIDGSVDSSHNIPPQTFNTDKNNKGKKRPSIPDDAPHHAELNQSHKKSLLNLELKTDSRDMLLKQRTSNKPGDSNQFKSHSHFATNVTIADENSFHYKHQPNIRAEVYNKNIRKLEPPPPPPLFLGNEDKDYRILPKNIDTRKPNETTFRKCLTVPVVKSFTLDNKDRKVYFVNDRSFAFLDDNTPRELTFAGPPRLVYIEGLSQPIELGFGGDQVKFEIDGKYNVIKFGTPAREVYINDHPYEAQFGGPPFTAMLSDEKLHRIRINGPLPQVVLSNAPAFELYERFCMNNREFLQRFDSEPNINNDLSHIPVTTHDVDMRMNNNINNRKISSFFNFPLEKMNDINWQRIHVGNSQQTEWTVPKNSFETCKDVKSNFVTHRNFSENPEWNRPMPLPETQNSSLNIPPPLPPKQIINRFPGMPPPPTFGSRYSDANMPLMQHPMNQLPRAMPPNNVPFPRPVHNSTEYTIAPEMNKMNMPVIRRLSPPPLPPFMGPIPSTSCMTSSLSGPVSVPYNVTTVSAPMHASPLLNLPPAASVTRLAAPMPVPNLSASTQMPGFTIPGKVPVFTSVQVSTSTTTTTSNAPVNMDLFLEKLVAAGLIGKTSGPPTPPSAVESERADDVKEEPLKEVSIPEITFEPKSLKEFHSGVISALYNGSQCATCGMRFKEIQSEQYSRHLDWHFRRNRREKDGAKKPFSRRWFYEIKDWIEFKEFEDVDERAPSYFELLANVEQPEEVLPENISSVPCSECESENCAVCGEQFQLFWVEEEEEWHLRNAVKHDDQVYHPACYEDFKKANESTVTDPDTSMDESTVDVKPDIRELDSNMKIKTEEMHVDIKKPTEFDVSTKEKIKSEAAIKEDKYLYVKGEEKQTDIDVKKETGLNVNVKEARKLDVHAKGVTKLDVIAKEGTKLDVAIKEETKLDGHTKESTKLDVTSKEGTNLDVHAKEKTKLDVHAKEKTKLDVIAKEGTKIDVASKEGAKVNVTAKERSKIDVASKEGAKVNVTAKERSKIDVASKEGAKVNVAAKEGSKVDVAVKEGTKIDVAVKEGTKIDVAAKEGTKIDVAAKEGTKIDVAAKEKTKLDVSTKKANTITSIKENVKQVKLSEAKLAVKKDDGETTHTAVKDIEIDIEKHAKEANIDTMKDSAETDINVKQEPKELEHDIKKDDKVESSVESHEKELDHKEETIPESTISDIKCNEKDELKSETIKGQIIIKTEPMDIDEVETDDKLVKEKCEKDITVNNSNIKPVKTDNIDEQSKSSSQVENVPIKLEDELEDIEFHPPTPDPRFEVLPPVSRGTEISNLCIIM